MQISVVDKFDKVRAEWGSELPDLDTSPMEVIGRILRAEHLADIEIREAFRSYGLDRGGFDVLATLRRSGAPYRLTPTQLYEELVLTSGAMTHRVDALALAGLVERIRDQEDRRSTLVGLTDKGKATIDRVMRTHMEVEAAMIADLAPNDRSALAGSLKKLLHLMEERRGRV